ncbi:unnamed protein product, partial [Closterium sp. Naga37s-1]
ESAGGSTGHAKGPGVNHTSPFLTLAAQRIAYGRSASAFMSQGSESMASEGRQVNAGGGVGGDGSAQPPPTRPLPPLPFSFSSQMLITVLEEMVARNVLANAIAVLPVKSLSRFLQFCRNTGGGGGGGVCCSFLLSCPYFPPPPVPHAGAGGGGGGACFRLFIPFLVFPPFAPPLPQFHMLAQVVGRSAGGGGGGACAGRAGGAAGLCAAAAAHLHCCQPATATATSEVDAIAAAATLQGGGMEDGVALLFCVP